MDREPRIPTGVGQIDRRSFLHRIGWVGAALASAGLLAACSAGKVPRSSPTPDGMVGPSLPPDVPPDLALRTLLEGNARYQAELSIHPNLSAERRAELVQGQNPWSAVLSCSDSRVPPELIFDVGPGDMFTVRVAGNVPSESSIESVEYAIGHLRVSLVLVMGHSGCGAVHAVLAGEAGGIPEIAHLIKPAVQGMKGDEAAAVRANTLAQRQNLLDAHAIALAVDRGDVEVRASVFDLNTGAAEMVDTT